MYKQLTIAIVALACATAVFAHETATGIVKERMDQMSAVAKSMKAIAAMIKGTEPYDTNRVRELASEIGARSGTHLTRLFPEGSQHPPTEALPGVWSDWPRFAEQAERMRSAADALVDGAEPDTSRALFQTLAATCKSCHDTFRLEK